MKLSKANEEALKGLAKFLKDFPNINVFTLGKTSGVTQEEMLKRAKALEKDLRRLRANLKDMPEPMSVQVADLKQPELCEDEGCPQANTDHVCVNDTIISPIQAAVAEAEANGQDPYLAGISARGFNLKEGELTLTNATISNVSGFEEAPAFYINPEQIKAQSKLIAVRYQPEEPVFTKAVFLKKTNA